MIKRNSVFKLLGTMVAVTGLLLVFAGNAFAALAVTENATNVTSTKAQLNGWAVGNGGESKFWYAFEYGPTTEYGSYTPTRMESEKASVHPAEPITGLSPNTTYHFRLVVLAQEGPAGKGGLFFGNDLTFRTDTLPLFKAAYNPPFPNPYIAVGEQSASDAFEFTTPSSIEGSGETFEVHCGTVKFESPESGSTTALQLGASYSKCNVYDEVTGELLYPSSIRMNSCKFISNVAVAGPPYVGTLGIACSKEGDAIEVDLWNFCTLSVAAQSATGKITYENQGEGTSATVTEKVGQTSFDYTEKGIWCYFGGSGEDARFSWTTSLGAVDSKSGEPRGLKVSGSAE